jgi:hypothetical protein
VIHSSVYTEMRVDRCIVALLTRREVDQRRPATCRQSTNTDFRVAGNLCLKRLDPPALGEGRMAFGGDHKVIKESDFDEVKCSVDARGEFAVGCTGL